MFIRITQGIECFIVIICVLFTSLPPYSFYLPIAPPQTRWGGGVTEFKDLILFIFVFQALITLTST